MLKHLFVLILVAVTTTGCLPKRQVLEGNVFQSGSPALSIKISPDLVYLGMSNAKAFNLGTGESRYRSAPSRHEVYYFLETESNRKARRFLIIQISHLVERHWYYIDNFHERWEKALRLDQEERGDRTYKTASLISSLKGGDFAEYLNANSYFLADCYALKILNRIYSQSNMLTLWYGEDCEPFSRRFDETKLNENQQRGAILEALDESFAESVTFQN